jgi:hypothetical protein
MSEFIESAPDDRWGWAGDTALWFGVLGPPIIALVHQQAEYLLVPKYCHTGSALWLHLVSLVCLAIAALAGITAWSCLARAPSSGQPNPEPPVQRPNFMALVGLASSGLGALIIIAQAVATFMLDPCIM